jgi:hypothetical protein
MEEKQEKSELPAVFTKAQEARILELIRQDRESRHQAWLDEQDDDHMD